MVRDGKGECKLLHFFPSGCIYLYEGQPASDRGLFGLVNPCTFVASIDLRRLVPHCDKPWQCARPSPPLFLSSYAHLPAQSSRTFVTSLGFSDFVRSKVWKTHSSFLISHKPTHGIVYCSQAQFIMCLSDRLPPFWCLLLNRVVRTRYAGESPPQLISP